jgi:integrase
MTPRKRASRIYWRARGGERRAWADFRDYADVQGKREPLVPEGQQLATTDPDIAVQLVARRLEELEGHRRRRALTGRSDTVTLGMYARDYLIAKKRAGKVTDGWIAACQDFLERAVAFFGVDRPLEQIRVSDVRAWAAHIQTLKGKTGRKLGSETARRHLFALSNLYRFAQEDELVPPGFNPVAALSEKPPCGHREAVWLEVPDAAILLESARRLLPVQTPGLDPIGADMAYPLVATFLLTGGRRAEVLGLELDDISFDRKTVTFRPNKWRRLKNTRSRRVVPMWPQLEEILRAWVFGRRLEMPGRLLFPSFATGEEARFVEIRKVLDRVAKRGGWQRGEFYTRALRHSYCAARLQTLDHGAPVTPYTVSREMGHGSLDMVERVYAHLGTIRHRSEVVEYRVEQHAEKLRDRLQALGFGTTNDTAARAVAENNEPRHQLSDNEVNDSDEWARRDSNPRPLAPEASALSN